MKKLIIILTLYSCCIAAVQAQQDDNSSFKAFTNFYAGPAYINFHNSNSFVHRSDVLGNGDNITNTAAMAGAGIYYMHNKLIFGMSGYGISGKEGTYNTGKLDIGAYSWVLNAGYITSQRNNIFSYVYGGIGIGGHSLEIDHRNRQESYFDKFLLIRQPDTERYTINGLALEAGYSYKWFVGRKSANANSAGLCIGLDGGAQYVLFPAWNSEVVNGPARYNPFVVYVRLCIGFYVTSKGEE